MKQKKQPIFRKCSTVGALIKQLERLPKTAPLSEPVHPKFDAAAKDAERYRLLRRGQHWSVIDGIGDTLRADDLDAAIDAVMAETPNAALTGRAAAGREGPR